MTDFAQINASVRSQGSTRVRDMSVGDDNGAGFAIARAVIGYFLVAFVLVAAVPMASNRPVAWMAEAAVLGAALIAFYGYLLCRGQRVATLAGYAVPLGAGAVTLAFSAVQIMPIGGVEDVLFSALPEPMQPRSISVDRGASIAAMLRLGAYLAFFVLSVHCATNAQRVNRLAWLLYWGIFAHAMWGGISTYVLGDVAVWGQKAAYLGVPTGTFVNRNSFATFMGMGLCIGIALALNHGRRAKTRPLGGGARMLSERGVELALIWISIAVLFAVILATQSRMGVIATLFGAAAVVTLMLPKLGSGRALFRWAIAAVVIAALYGAGTAESFLFTEQSTATRLGLYAQIVDAIAQRPLVGYGLDAFPAFYEVAMRPPVPGYYVWDKAHSTYLALWLEFGLIVGTLPMLALGWCARRAFCNAKRRSSAFAVPAATVGVIVVGAVHSTVDFSLEIPANVFVVLFMCALGTAKLSRGRIE